nr:hypothetical protein [Rhodococcus sp. 06-235-1A]
MDLTADAVWRAVVRGSSGSSIECITSEDCRSSDQKVTKGSVFFGSEASSQGPFDPLHVDQGAAENKAPFACDVAQDDSAVRVGLLPCNQALSVQAIEHTGHALLGHPT